MLYGISGIMSIAAILFSKDLFVETAGLLIIAGSYIYIFVTNAKGGMAKAKAASAGSENADVSGAGNAAKGADKPEPDASATDALEAAADTGDIAIAEVTREKDKSMEGEEK